MSSFKKKQIAYTLQREKAYQEYLKAQDEDLRTKLIKLYNKHQNDIQRQIEHQYLRYAGKEGLSMDDAMKKISKFDAASFADKAKQYVEERDFSDRANEELRAYNLKMRVSRLELMKREMLLETIDLADKENKMLYKHLSDVALEELNRQAVILKLPQEVRQRIIKNADLIINADFHGTSFSNRIWANQTELQNRLETGLERTILQGRNHREWARSLTDLLTQEMADTGKANAMYAAERLAKTETSRVFSEVALESYREGGFEQYIFITENDDRVCGHCVPLDGMVFNVADAVIGENMSPIHANCRCTTAAYMDREEWYESLDRLGESLRDFE